MVNWQLQLEKNLQQREQAHLYRSRLCLSRQAGKVTYNNQPCINFCSNDYLDLAQHPAVIAAMQTSINKCGVGGRAAQLVSGYSEAHRDLEIAFANFMGYERALLFSSGYLANLGVLDSLADKDTVVFVDKYSHASILDGVRLSGAQLIRYRHLDIQHLKQRLAATMAAKKIIVTDGVFSMQGDIAPLVELARLAKQYGCLLIVDDAHGVGVLGEHGRGCSELLQLDATQLPVIICPLGKAFAASGALVVANAIMIEHFIQFARSYIYDTAPPPSIAAATLQSLEIIQTDSQRRAQLAERISYFRQLAQQHQLPLLPSVTPIQCILINDVTVANQLAEQLLVEGFLVRAMRSPTVPPHATCLRVTLTCAHEFTDIKQFVTAVRRCYAALQ